MIEVREIYKTFNPHTPLENPVLRGMSLSLQQGEFVTVIGSNGAGKSTLLNAISGEIRVDSGAVLINGQEVSKLPAYKRSAQVARVFQDPLAGTCAHLSIEENLALAMKRGQGRGLARAVQARYLSQFTEALAALNLGIEQRLKDRMGLLSGGQRQAVSLLMASLQPSGILLLDEHTAALDPKTANFVLSLTQQIVAKKSLTTLMVTHSMRQALDIGSRTVMLHQGQVIFDISGAERASLDVPDLLALFEKQRGQTVSDDSLLLG